MSSNKHNKQAVQNEAFYVKKRALFRRAEAVVRQCNSDCYVIVHHKDSDKIFSFTSGRDFTLEKIAGLVLRDVQQGQSLKKNQKYNAVNWQQVNASVAQIKRLTKGQQRSEPDHQFMGEGPVDEMDTVTEEMSMSLQFNPNMASAGKRTNEHSRNTMMSPKSGMKIQRVTSDNSDSA